MARLDKCNSHKSNLFETSRVDIIAPRINFYTKMGNVSKGEISFVLLYDDLQSLSTWPGSRGVHELLSSTYGLD